ncbi:hypothetical protein SLS64_009744 [Diaporthe eres]|uniref:Uncharacterized protein n=1 Tax=Diaporthe eres TaxID=83184 RepID=A0ABR1NYA4_DIAER
MNVQNKNSNWLGWRIFDVLSPQTDKIKGVVHNQWLDKGGWEGWAQFELAYGLSRYMGALAEAKTVGGDEFDYDLVREENYPETDQRFDFHLSCSLTTALQFQHWKSNPNSTLPDPRSRDESYFAELKCQGGWETMDKFVYRVEEDLQKIKDCRPQKLRGRGGTHRAVWMIAITTLQHGGSEDVKMHNLGTKWNLNWQVIPLPGRGFLKIWAGCIQMKGNTEDSLFAYST